MKIAVLTIHSFPYGMAATNRIAAYAQGLVENNNYVDVISIHPPDAYTNTERLPDYGSYNGVNYVHPSGRYRNRFKVLRFLAMKTNYRSWMGRKKVSKILNSKRYDYVIMSFDEPNLLKQYTDLIHQSGAKAIFIFDEYPTPIRHYLKDDIPEWKKRKYCSVLSKVDGYISISYDLCHYFNAFAKKPTFIMPIILNTSRFPLMNEVRINSLRYIGNMELSKDNVDNIIRAFSLISPEFPDYVLELYGTPADDDKNKLLQLISDLKLENKVSLKGRLNSEEVAKIIATSKIMLSSQPDTLRAKGGFPTKLGEYVCMATPTLICNVGENAKYLSDDEECFFVEPGNPQKYADKIKMILLNYDNALKIAKAGASKVRESYSQKAMGKRLSDFLEGI